MKTPRRAPLRRLLLGALMLALGGPAVASGCAGGFAPVSQVDSLRVLAVQADKPYGVDCAPCTPEGACTPTCTLAKEVTFTMTVDDGLVATPRPLQIVWLGGCFDPVGDEYYACYPELAQLFQGGFDLKTLLASGLVGVGDTFTLPLPADSISRRPQPAAGAPYYGLAYVFFAVCAGTLGPVPPEGDGGAGSFPIGCFDAQGDRLGADSFVPGYTQVYAFSDLRSNGNPVVTGLTFDGRPLRDGSTAEVCPISIDERLGPPGCGRADPFTVCAAYDLSVIVPDDVAEIDPDGTTPTGGPLHEVVWVDYFADKGSLDSPVALVSDATSGIQRSHGTRWIGPPEPGPVNLWGVVHDARGGETVVHRTIEAR